MKFNPKALLILIGLASLLGVAVSTDGGGWVHFAEAVASIVMLVGLAGFLRGGRFIASSRL
jgi:hypothetical protein